MNGNLRFTRAEGSRFIEFYLEMPMLMLSSLLSLIVPYISTKVYK
jgi:hypothetical protein